jgi:hypothetical protein
MEKRFQLFFDKKVEKGRKQSWISSFSASAFSALGLLIFGFLASAFPHDAVGLCVGSFL